jgi:hypothetical protein
MVTSAVLRTAWYRFRTTLGRRWGGYLALILLVGVVGGLAMGSIAAARRTQSSFPAYLASSHPSDLNGVTAFINPMPGNAGVGYDPSIETTIARLPQVAKVSSQSGLNIIPLGRHGAPESPAAYPASAGEVIGLDDAVPSNLDNPSVVQGRMLDPRLAGEFVVSPTTAQVFGLQVGQTVRFGVYTNAQTNLPAFGTAAVVPYRRFTATLVGIVLQASSVVEDETDAGNNSNLLALSPALTRPLLQCCAYFSAAAVKVAGGGNVAEVQREITHILPPGFSPFAANPAPAIEAKAERAIKPESIALGVFGAICALAALLIAAQVIGRQLRLGADDLGAVRALGADRRMTIGDGLIGTIGAVIIGSLVAAAVAVGLSPLSPLGPVRPVDPTPGVAFDWTVLGLGVLVLVVGLSAVALLVAYRLAPDRHGSRRHLPARQRSAIASYAASSGLPESAVTGVRFALEPGTGRAAVPVRSAILGSALAVIVVISTVTFGASLTNLISHPALYGWNWSYELTANQGGVIPGARAARLLAQDDQVAAWSGISFGTMRIDGRIGVPVLAESPNSAVAPPLLSGHGVGAKDQTVLGPLTLAQLHKQVGDTVTVGDGSGPMTRLRIVGTATMPTIGGGQGNQHLEMGSGAVLATDVLPGNSQSGYSNLPGSAPGPAAIVVRLTHGADPAGLRSLQRIASAVSTPADYGVTVLAVQRPAEIVNYRSMGSTPAILGAALAAGAVAALGLTLIASVRWRRRDLALMKTLGFTRRQLAAAVAWQSSVAVGIGTLVGVPLGIIVGRSLWITFTHEIDVVPIPTVPALTVVLIALGALVLANLVAAVPGRLAARTSTAVLLRSE